MQSSLKTKAVAGAALATLGMGAFGHVAGADWAPASQDDYYPPVIAANDDGSEPAGASTSAAVLACANLKHCAWTGTYRSGSRFQDTPGRVPGGVNWNGISDPTNCTGSSSGGTFKNCARSTQNRSGTYGFRFYTELNGGGTPWNMAPGTYYATLWSVFDRNIDSSNSCCV